VALSIHEWVKVLTQPLGLAGFALFLIFQLLGRKLKAYERRWAFVAMVAMSVICLLGGLGLAYRHEQKQEKIEQVQQQSSGAGSPNVQGVQGDVNITIDQSKAGTGEQKNEKKGKSPEKKEQ
jgi:hypothetical protein